MTVLPQSLTSYDGNNTDRPLFENKKTSVLAVIGVVALHGVAGYALINMTMPKVQPPKVTPPLEITFVAPPEVVKPKIEPTVEPTIEPLPKPKAEPKIEKSLEKKVEPVKPQPVKKTQIQPKTEPIVDKKPEPTVETKPKIDQNLLIAQQRAKDNERAEQARQNELNRQNELAKQQEAKQLEARQLEARQQEAKRQQDLADAQAKAKKQAEADAENARQQALANAKAKQAADDKAKKDKEDAAKKAAESNTPVTFTVGQIRWKSKPNFNCGDTDGEPLNASFHFRVDKQGNIISSNLSRPTGNTKVDRLLQRQAQSAKFYPFTKDGVPVVGSVNIPILCK